MSSSLETPESVRRFEPEITKGFNTTANALKSRRLSTELTPGLTRRIAARAVSRPRREAKGVDPGPGVSLAGPPPARQLSIERLVMEETLCVSMGDPVSVGCADRCVEDEIPALLVAACRGVVHGEHDLSGPRTSKRQIFGW